MNATEWLSNAHNSILNMHKLTISYTTRLINIHVKQINTDAKIGQADNYA